MPLAPQLAQQSQTAINNFDAKPFIIQTFMTVSWRNQTGFFGSKFKGCPPLYPFLIYWFNPTAVGDKFKIVNPLKQNMILLEGRCEVSHQSQLFSYPPSRVSWQDFQVIILGSGTLEIWY
jgi:hypothetical protein